MPALTLSGRLIWFAHCPKAGGTSIEQLMVSRWGARVSHLHWGWDKWWRQGGWRVADPPNSPQHLIWQDAVRQLPKAPDAVFALVRDPVARMASEHRWQRRHRRGTRLGRMLAHLPFGLWLRIMLAAVRRNPHAFDNHFRPQSDFVPDGAVVFRLEDGLSPAVAWLAEVTGEPVSELVLPHALSSGQSPPCSRGCARLIVDTFAEDYARFGYVPPVPPVCKSTRVHPVVLALAALVAWLDRRACL